MSELRENVIQSKCTRNGSPQRREERGGEKETFEKKIKFFSNLMKTMILKMKFKELQVQR